MDTALKTLQTLREDYARFPRDQTYSLYAENVHFKDPMSDFRGRRKFQAMIGFMHTAFLNCKMDLHHIEQHEDLIRMDWTLSWNTPLPWKPRIAIPGWSELRLNPEGTIVSQVDYWRCSRLDVLKQHFQFKKNKPA
ncbi:MAG TPA: DUF2358 domain-containing protein [Thermosynechococcaceae cyanobacterium]